MSKRISLEPGNAKGTYGVFFTGTKPTNISWNAVDSNGNTDSGTDTKIATDFPAFTPEYGQVYWIKLTITSDWNEDLIPFLEISHPLTEPVVGGQGEAIQEDFSQRLTIKFSRTRPTPTYLEELHKLDNYTKAQYIPENVSKVPR